MKFNKKKWQSLHASRWKILQPKNVCIVFFVSPKFSPISNRKRTHVQNNKHTTLTCSMLFLPPSIDQLSLSTILPHKMHATWFVHYSLTLLSASHQVAPISLQKGSSNNYHIINHYHYRCYIHFNHKEDQERSLVLIHRT